MSSWWFAHKAGLTTVTAILLALSGGASLHERQAKTQPFAETVRKTGDELQNSALKRVEPRFPEETVFVNQKIIVEVTVDQSGDVILVRPIFGHSLFRSAAVEAARGWKFPPSVQDKPMKVVGTITFSVPRLVVTPERLQELQAYVRDNPSSAEGHYKLARAYDVLRRITEAVDECQRAVEIDPQSSVAYLELGELLSSLTRYRDARTAFATALRLRPDLVEARYRMAAAALELGSSDEAEGIWTELTEKSQDLQVLDTAYKNLLGTYRFTGQDDKVLYAAQKLVAIETELIAIIPGPPLGPHVYSYISAQRYEKLGRNVEALEAYKHTIDIVQRLIQEDPNAEEAAFSYFHIGALIEKDGRYNEAIQNYQQAIRMKPNLYEARLNLGLLYLKSGDRESARKEYLALKSANSELAGELGKLLSK